MRSRLSLYKTNRDLVFDKVIEIDLNDLLAQGVRRRRDKEAKKQERKERRKWTKKGVAGPKDSLQNESNSQVNEETRITE